MDPSISTLMTHSFPRELPRSLYATWSFVGPELGLRERVVYSNPWLFAPLLRQRYADAPSLRRTVQMVVHFQEEASPPGDVDRDTIRLHYPPGRTRGDVLSQVNSVLAKSGRKATYTPHAERLPPPEPASIDTDGFRAVQRAIGEVFPDAIVAPVLATVRSDARHFRHLTPHLYRFSPLVTKTNERFATEGVDENISRAELHRAIQFYVQLLRHAAGAAAP